MSDTRSGNEIFNTTPTADQSATTPQAASSAGFQTVNVMRDEFGYETPVDLVPLPSQGRIYPPESGFHGKETVEVRSMTAKEEDILTSRALIKKGTVITELIKSCLVDKTLDVNVLTSGDRNAIMTALRVTGSRSISKHGDALARALVPADPRASDAHAKEGAKGCC